MEKTMSAPAIGTRNGHKLNIFSRAHIFLTSLGGRTLTKHFLLLSILSLFAFCYSSQQIAQASDDGPPSREEAITFYKEAKNRFEEARQQQDVKDIETEFRKAQDTAAKIDRQTTELSAIRVEVRSKEKIQDRPIFNKPKENKMFARYSRTATAGNETFQEYDTDLSVKAGPDERIYLHSGEVVFSESDFTLPARGGIGFTFTRTYRSQITYQGPLGRNWDHNHNQRLILDQNNLDWFTGQRRIRFTRKGKKEPWHAEGAFYRVEFPDDPDGDNQATSIDIFSPDQTRFRFEPAKHSTPGEKHFRIKEISSPHGDWKLNALKYHYHEGTDFLQSVTDPHGREIQFFYDAKGFLSSVLFEDYIVNFQYNEKEHALSNVRIPQVAIAPADVGSQESTDLASSYKYQPEEDGAEITNNSPEAWLIATNPPGSAATLTFAYDLNSESEDYKRVISCRKMSIKDTFDDAANNSNNSSTDEGATWDFKYTLNRQTNEHIVSITPPKPDPLTNYYFANENDSGNKPSRLCQKQIIPARDAKWEFEYDSDGQLVKEVKPEKSETRYTYDTNNRLRALQSRLLSEKHIGNTRDFADSRTFPNAKFSNHLCREFGTEWKYGEATASFPEQEISYEILENGTRKNLLKTTFEYDKHYDLIKSYVGDSKQITQWTRNRYGLPVVECDALGACNYFEYEQSQADDETVPVAQRGGRLSLSQQDADPEEIIRLLEAASLIPSLVKRTVVIPPVSDETHYQYDVYGNIETLKEPDGTVRYANNKMGMPLASLDTRTDLTLTQFNDQLLPSKRWQRITFPKGHDADNESEPNEAQPALNRFTWNLPDQNEYEMLYKGAPLANYGTFYTESFEYDFLGRMEKWVQTDQKFQKAADRKDKIMPTVKFEWFPNGALKRRTLPTGLAIQHDYDPSGQLKSQLLIDTTSDNDEQESLKIKSDITYDKDGFLKSYRGDNDAVYRFFPDAFGRNFEVQQPDKTVTQSFLDGLGRVVTSRTFHDGDEDTLLIERRYEFDSAGNPTVTKVHRIGPVPADDNRDDLPQDTVDRILVEQQLEYDDAGNIIKRQDGYRSDAHTHITHDGLRRPVVLIAPEGDTTVTIFKNRQACFQDAFFHTDDPVKTKRLGQLGLYDGVRRFAAFPVDTDGNARPERSTFMLHDAQGRLIQQAQAQKTVTLIGHDSRDNVVLNKTLGLARPSDKTSTDSPGMPPPEPITYAHHFDPNGQLIYTTLRNKPITFKNHTHPHDAVKGIEAIALREPSGDQTTAYYYDIFGRLQQTHFPDDKHKYTRWNEASLPTFIDWQRKPVYLFNNKIIKPRWWWEPTVFICFAAPTVVHEGEAEGIHFKFDKMRRLTAISKDRFDDENPPLQNFQYDLLGNLALAIDRGNPDFPIRTERQFDNLGTLLSESTSIRDPKNDHENPIFQNAHCDFEMTSKFETGQRYIQITKLRDEHELLWDRIRLTSDRQGRLIKTAVNTTRNEKLTEACNYAYTGNQVRQRNFPQGKINETITLSPLLEPFKYKFADVADLAAKKRICELNYELGPTGQVIGSSLDVPSKNIRRSTFYHYDAFSRLIGEVTKERLFPSLKAEQQKAFAEDYYWQARRFTYDQAGNRTRSFRQDTNDSTLSEDASALEKNTWQWYSSSTPWNSHQPKQERVVKSFIFDSWYPDSWKTVHIPNSIPKETVDQLCSNRLGSIWSPADPSRVEREFTYDGLGRLTNFPSIKHGENIKWQIEYDPLWRVRQMRYVSGDRSMTLDFATDAFNRRILKQVKENDAVTNREVTSYLDRNPNVVKSNTSGTDWDVRTQYLWGARDKELLMSFLSRSSMGEGETGFERYYFHQDRGLNVFMATLPQETGNVKILDVASYLGFGENSTQSQVSQINVSQKVNETPETQQSAAFDKNINDNDEYNCSLDGSGWLAIKLKDLTDTAENQQERTPRSLEQLNIWTDNFPKTFDVYVTDDKDSYAELTRQLDAGNAEDLKDLKVAEVKNCNYQEGYRQRKKIQGKIQDPYNIPLAGKKGNWIIIAWPGNEGDNKLEVTEFEVIVRPLQPTSIAFAGSWLDRETGLYCYGVRYRLPSMGGKFISPDPLGYAAGHNLYAYGYNDPLTWHDPNGEHPALIILGAAIAGAAGESFFYLADVYISEDKEFSWKHLSYHAGAGAAAGAAAAGVTMLSVRSGNPYLIAAAGGGTYGATRGAILGFAHEMENSGDWSDSFQTAGKQGVRDGAIGAGTATAITAAGPYLAAVGPWAAKIFRPRPITIPTRNPIPTIARRKPINSQWAGKTHPSGVKFNERGFPMFTPQAKATVKLNGLTGNSHVDSKLANKAAGFNKTPTGHTWHHVEDGKTMQLVPTNIHERARHTGGASIIKNGGFD